MAGEYAEVQIIYRKKEKPTKIYPFIWTSVKVVKVYASKV